MCNDMKEYIIFGGVNGVGKSSFKGILLGEKYLDEECLHETSDFSGIEDIIHNAHFEEYFVKIYNKNSPLTPKISGVCFLFQIIAFFKIVREPDFRGSECLSVEIFQYPPVCREMK